MAVGGAAAGMEPRENQRLDIELRDRFATLPALSHPGRGGRDGEWLQRMAAGGKLQSGIRLTGRMGGALRSEDAGRAENHRSMAIRGGSLWESASQPSLLAIRLRGCAADYNMFAKAAVEGRA